MVEITSKELRIQIEEEGAQLSSIYDLKDQVEYLWQKDAVLWTSSSPVVFPVIGKLNNMECYIDGKWYHMKSNGIIRYETLQVVEQGENYVTFLFQNGISTKENYPYECRFYIRYEVVDRYLSVQATIHNDDTKPMYYNYAGHPGFRVPLYESESSNDYYIEFEEEESTSIFDVCESGQLLDMKSSFLSNEKRFFLRKQLFKKEALAFHHPKSKKVSIKSLHHNKEIVMHYDGFDNLAIWSPYKEDQPLRFICIEPWIGHTDFKGYCGEFKERDEIATLDAKKTATHTYQVEFK